MSFIRKCLNLFKGENKSSKQGDEITIEPYVPFAIDVVKKLIDEYKSNPSQFTVENIPNRLRYNIYFNGKYVIRCALGDYALCPYYPYLVLDDDTHIYIEYKELEKMLDDLITNYTKKEKAKKATKLNAKLDKFTQELFNNKG